MYYSYYISHLIGQFLLSNNKAVCTIIGHSYSKQPSLHRTFPEVSAHDGATTEVNTSSSRAPPNNQCFSEFIDDEKLTEMGKGLIPANTTTK